MPPRIKINAKAVFAFMAREPFFVVTLVLTVALSFFSAPHFSAVKWNVIATLFSLMLICHAFDRCQLLSSVAGAALGVFKTPRKLGLAMIFATGALAMFITNDVALLAVVPLTMKMAKVSGKDPVLLIILETMSANLFSAMTPFGNPQNLYLYSYFNIPPLVFFKMMVPFCIIGIALIVIINLVFNSGAGYKVEARKFQIYDNRLLAGSSVALALNVLSVLRILDYRISLAATLIIVLYFAPRLITKVDYVLLLTFILFFLFSDSVTGIQLVREFFSGVLNSGTSVLLASSALSQVISNVPAAVLLSGFTADFKDLLFGVSAGGLGTLIASLASLISYKFYISEYKPGKYIKVFSAFNFSVLIIMIIAVIPLERIL